MDDIGSITREAMTRIGLFDELMAESEGPLRPIVTRLREVILSIHPGAAKVVRMGDRAATWLWSTLCMTFTL